MSESSFSGGHSAWITSLYLGFCGSSGTFVQLPVNVYKAIWGSLEESTAGMQSMAVLWELNWSVFLLYHLHTCAVPAQPQEPSTTQRPWAFFCCFCRREGCLCVHAHRGREILVLPASCSAGSGHHHCHFTSDCPDSGNCLLGTALREGVGSLWRHSSCPLVSAAELLLGSLDVSVCFPCPGIGEDSRGSLVWYFAFL